MKKYLSAALILMLVLLLAVGCAGESHELVKTEAKAPTCTVDGHTEYWTCVSCSKVFSDAEAQHEISVFDTFLSALGHRAEEDDGSCLTELKCTRCDEVIAPAQTAHIPNVVTDCTLTTLCQNCPTVLILGRDDHESGEATCITPATCIHCGMETGQVDPTNHAKAPTYLIDETHHTGSYPCCGQIFEDMATHSFIEGFCTCGIRQTHENTVSITNLPNAGTIRGWQEGDELLVTIHSELFGQQTVLAVYGKNGKWQFQKNAYWVPGEKVTAVVWYAPGFTVNEKGEVVAKPGDAVWKEEYLLASTKLDSDNLLRVNFSSAVRSYSVFCVKTAPNTKVHVAMYNYKPANEEEFLEGIMPEYMTDDSGVIWFYGTFAPGGRYVICNDNGDTLGEASFPNGTVAGQLYKN